MTTETQHTLFDILLQQSPVIILLCIVCYIMYLYINKRDQVIKEKDTLIIEQTEKLMVLYGNAIESQNRLSHVIEELRKDIEKIKP
jgi:hypothetical protein